MEKVVDIQALYTKILSAWRSPTLFPTVPYGDARNVADTLPPNTVVTKSLRSYSFLERVTMSAGVTCIMIY